MENAARESLLAEFNARRAKLAEQLGIATNLTETVSIVRRALDDLQRRRIDQLTAPQARRMAELFAVLRAAVGMLAAASKTQILYARPSQPPISGQPGAVDAIKRGLIQSATGVRLPVVRAEALKIRVMQGVICLGLVFGLFLLTRESLTAWPAILLVLALGGFELRLWQRSGSSEGYGAAASETRVEVRVDVTQLLDDLASALDMIDRAMGEVGTDAAERRSGAADRSPIESVPELLAVLQDLLGEALLDDASLTLKRSKELPAALARFGVGVQSYAATDATLPDGLRSDDMFDVEPSLDPGATGTVMLKPALVRSGKVLLRGRVVVPAGSTGI